MVTVGDWILLVVLVFVVLAWFYLLLTVPLTPETTPPQDRASPPNPNDYCIPEDCRHEDW